MPYKITNITEKTLKNGLPLQLTYTIGNEKAKKVLEVGQSFYLYFLPKEIHQFQIRNFVHVEFVKNIEPDPIVIPLDKEVKIVRDVTEVVEQPVIEESVEVVDEITIEEPIDVVKKNPIKKSTKPKDDEIE